MQEFLFKEPMILFEEALRIVTESAGQLDSERVSLDESIGRALAADVYSDMNMPPFNKSAVDGYACRYEDINNELFVIEVIPAGKEPEKSILPGQCSKIMTGAIVPDGADAVIMVEDTEEISENKVRFTRDKSSLNICYLGEDVKEGQVVLKKGTLISPQVVGVLASVGCISPLVSKKPVVGIISTGDELVEPENKPGRSQIRNSNNVQLVAQVKRSGAVPKYFGIAKDTESSTYQKISEALRASDVILISGGVSMGDFDYVPAIFDKLGVRTIFKSIAVQPGKPTVFGVITDKYLFGLPGNPVSSFVQFEMLVKPLLFKLMGLDHKPQVFKLEMGETYKRKKSKRKSFLPVFFKDGKVYPVEYHGSAHLHSYIYADGIVAVEIGETILEKGALVDVRQI